MSHPHEPAHHPEPHHVEPVEDPHHEEATHGEAHPAEPGHHGTGGIEPVPVEPKAPEATGTSQETKQNQDWINNQLGKNKPAQPTQQVKPGGNQGPSPSFQLEKSVVEVHHDPQGIEPFNRMVCKDFIGPQGEVLGIEPTELSKFIQEDPARDDYMIIDLRTTGDIGQNNEGSREIKGAKHLPISENPNGQAGQLDPKYMKFNSDLFTPSKDPAALEKVANNWKKLLADKTLPLAEAADKKYIFFHCRQSTTRTPYVASGYAQSLAKPGQHVIVIEGGFIAYANSTGALLDNYVLKEPLKNFGPKPAGPTMPENK